MMKSIWSEFNKVKKWEPLSSSLSLHLKFLWSLAKLEQMVLTKWFIVWFVKEETLFPWYIPKGSFLNAWTQMQIDAKESSVWATFLQWLMY